MFAATVANGGLLATPHLTRRMPPVRPRRAISQRTARLLTQMLRRAVVTGSGTGADLQGLGIAGKTGTVTLTGGDTLVWFVGFAPVQQPRVAIAVVLRAAPPSFGGTVAAPIAAQVISGLLSARR